MNNIQKVSDALMCSNCGACKAICPKNAITFQSTSIGRMYASVNDNCIDCGLCTKVCPSLDDTLHKTFADRYIGNISKVYIGRATDQRIFDNSQSGGVCTAILAYLLSTQKIDAAIVCKMTEGNIPIIKPTIVTQTEDLYNSQKSCYTPVDMISIIKETRQYKSIAIVGLPCHIQGAEKLIKTVSKFSNIKYKIGLICDRTLCSTIQNVMVSYCTDGNAKIEWRKKNFSRNGVFYSYKAAPIMVSYGKDKEYILPNIYRFALKEMFTTPRCRVCYDKLNTFADIVVGDPWGMTGVDWKKGMSVVITRNDIGNELITQLQATQHAVLTKASVQELIKGQHIDQRKSSVSTWSETINMLPQPINSYLFKQKDVPTQPSEIEKAKRILQQFIETEKLTQTEIVQQARKKVKTAVQRSKIRRWLPSNILRIIKSVIKS